MTDERREAKRAYKERTTPRGIFAVRCTATGEVWVGSAPNLDSVQNRIWFSLRHGHHPNTQMQAAWNAHGEGSFQFTTLDELDEDIAPLLVSDELKKRKRDWMARLTAPAV